MCAFCAIIKRNGVVIMEKTYIRLGEIPADGRSVNFLKMTSRQKDAFHYADIEGADTRADIPEE